MHPPGTPGLEVRRHVRVSDQFARVLERMVEHDPLRRYQSAADVLADLARTDGRLSALRAVAPATRKVVRRWTPREITMLAVIITGLLVTLVGYVAYLFMSAVHARRDAEPFEPPPPVSVPAAAPVPDPAPVLGPPRPAPRRLAPPKTPPSRGIDTLDPRYRPPVAPRE